MADLAKVSIAYGPMLNVDDWSSASLHDHNSRFFMPCDWPQEWLEYEAWVDPIEWIHLDQISLYSKGELLSPRYRSQWFKESLGELQDRCPDIWDVLSDCHTIGLQLPCREFHRPSRLGGRVHYHAYLGMFAYLAARGTDRPHAQCLIADSADKVTDHVLLRSEVETAICMCQYQLRDGSFVDHHTKPILITTVVRDQAARLTLAYFDGKQNKVVLRQSRPFDLSGKRPGPDAWTLLRWMASTPVGLTKHADAAESGHVYSDDNASLPPSLTIFDSP